MDIFITAAKKKYRFESQVGLLMVEDLFDLPLTNSRGASLDAVARKVNGQLKAQTEESFVETKSNPLKVELEEKLEIVKKVIEFRQAENEVARVRAANNEQRKKILDALESARNQKLSQASEEDLLKQLAALEA